MTHRLMTRGARIWLIAMIAVIAISAVFIGGTSISGKQDPLTPPPDPIRIMKVLQTGPTISSHTGSLDYSRNLAVVAKKQIGSEFFAVVKGSSATGTPRAALAVFRPEPDYPFCADRNAIVRTGVCPPGELFKWYYAGGLEGTVSRDGPTYLSFSAEGQTYLGYLNVQPSAPILYDSQSGVGSLEPSGRYGIAVIEDASATLNLRQDSPRNGQAPE